jgi:hypothetical protein
MLLYCLVSLPAVVVRHPGYRQRVVAGNGFDILEWYRYLLALMMKTDYVIGSGSGVITGLVEDNDTTSAEEWRELLTGLATGSSG